ncbi:MAG: site-2 protease family protein [Acutalibacteraceae bacterium]|jgi:stage IV sporulation protein FB
MRFNFFGTQVHIGFMFSAVIMLLMIFDKSNTAVFALMAAVLHEFAHLACLIFFEQPPKNVEINALGMKISRGQNTKLSLGKEAIVALAGPLMNFSVAFFTALLTNMSWTNKAIAINLSLAIFNLLPIFELDGGRAIYYLLCIKMQEKTASRVLTVFSVVTLFFLYLLGFLVLFKTKYNFTLIMATIYLTVLMITKNHW